MDKQIKYPKYYDYDDIPVVVEKDPTNGSITARPGYGGSMPPVKVMAEGREITKESFETVTKAYKDEHKGLITLKDLHALIAEHFGTQFFD